MTIKKLSLAAILSMGIVAGNLSLGFAGDHGCCPAAPPVITGPACPMSGCSKPVTPSTALCPKCHQPAYNCGCPKTDCGCPKVDCDCVPTSCDKPSIPTCATCPTPIAPCDVTKKQVYAYPENVYSHQQFIGSSNNGIAFGESGYSYGIGVAQQECGCTGAAANLPIINDCGCEVTGAAANLPIINNCGCKVTGAAANLPILNNCGCNVGVDVSRNPAGLDNAGCPIQIQTSSSMEGLRKSLVPFDVATTGAAAPIASAFEDVPDGFWASCDINRLTSNNIIAGYPDRTFKPNLPVSRAEMASLITKGLNVDTSSMNTCHSLFKDVPSNFWGARSISNAVTAGLMSGYPDNKFRPNQPVSKTEAMTILAKGINCPMDSCKADTILNQYCDGANVPSWAKIPVAKVIEAGGLVDNPQGNLINPQKDASRAELANMLQNVRVAIGYDKNDVASIDDCGCTGAAAYMEKDEVVTIPTLQLKFRDEISAKSATVGDVFAADTLEAVTINGCTYPCGSRVSGRVIEVVKPTKHCQGALKLVFTDIKNGDMKAALPRQILNAQVNKTSRPNFLIKAIEMPFTLVGGLVGTTGRTIGGMFTGAVNAVENVTDGVGVMLGETFRGEFRAAGRSLGSAVKNVVMAPIDFTRTALSGTMGLFQYTGDEIAYLVDPSGMRVSSINPKEKVTIAFGCK